MGVRKKSVSPGFLMTAEGVLIACFTPVVGLLIDVYGSVDRVLVLVGLCFLLGLTLLALISVLRSLKHSQRSQFARSTLREETHTSLSTRLQPGQAGVVSGERRRT